MGGHKLLLTSEPNGISTEVIDAVAPRSTLDLAVVTMGDRGHDVVSGVAADEHAGFAFPPRHQLCHLAETGHRRIAFVGPVEQSSFTRARLEHAHHTAHELGLPRLEVTTIATTADTGERADACGGWPREVTAVAAYSDDVARVVLDLSVAE